MRELKVKEVTAYTVRCSVDELKEANKGLYKSRDIASAKAIGCGWFSQTGRVITMENIFQDEAGELYEMKHLGKYTDEENEYKAALIESIKSKLSEEELKIIGLLNKP